ncbi:MAG: hypothetical protein AAGH82_09335 [Pseudomonadota bacterium]
MTHGSTYDLDALPSANHLRIPSFPRIAGELGSLVPFAAITFLFLAMTVPTLMAMALDSRSFQGDSIWLKPLKFQLSLAIFFGTVAWFGLYTSEAFRSSRAVHLFAYIACFAALAEIAWIGGAAMFGTASHFNTSSAFMAGIYSLMGAFAVTLTASALVVGIGVLRNDSSRLALAMKHAVGWSMIVTFVATVTTAGYMASQTGHLVGDEAQRTAHWLTGWSTQVGDLRVPHFFATHAMHIVPLFALGVAIFTAGRRGQMSAAWALLLGYSAFTAHTFSEAAAGRPFLCGLL